MSLEQSFQQSDEDPLLVLNNPAEMSMLEYVMLWTHGCTGRTFQNMWTKVSLCLLHDFSSMDCPCLMGRSVYFPPAFNAEGHTVLFWAQMFKIWAGNSTTLISLPQGHPTPHAPCSAVFCYGFNRATMCFHSLGPVLDDMPADFGGLSRPVGGYTKQSSLLSQQ